jgi:photosystem II stability/assembly factor-like uncharacterized protein
VLWGIKRGVFLAVLIGFALWPELTRGRTSSARAPESAQAAESAPPIRNFQRATEQPPWSGDLNAVAVKGSVVFAAAGGGCGETDGSGVFRSTDGGGTWTPLDDMQMSKSVRSLMFARSGGLFAATHDGVFRSTDFGNTWTPTGLLGVDVSTMASGPDVLFAADGCGCSGAYRSTDEGESWQKVNEGLAGCVRGMTVDPAGAVFAATASNGVYRSTDNGDTWAPANAGLTTLELKTVAVDGDGHLFVGSASDGVFRSTDGGATWARVGLSGLRVNTLAIRGNGIFAGTDSGVYRSTDDGYNWDTVDLGLSEPAQVRALALGKHGVAFAAAGRNVLRGASPLRVGFGGNPEITSILVTSPTVDSTVSAFGNLVTTLSWSHTVGTADILIVGTSNSGNKTVLSVTYGGTALTRQGFLNNGGKDRVEIWALLPNPPGLTSGQVTVTLSGAADLVAGSIAFSGVDPTTPLGTFASAQGNTNNPFLSLSTNTGAVVVDTLAVTGDALSVNALGGPNGQTSQWSNFTGALGTNVRGAGSTKTAAGTSTTMSWTLGAARRLSALEHDLRRERHPEGRPGPGAVLGGPADGDRGFLQRRARHHSRRAPRGHHHGENVLGRGVSWQHVHEQRPVREGCRREGWHVRAGQHGGRFPGLAADLEPRPRFERANPSPDAGGGDGCRHDGRHVGGGHQHLRGPPGLRPAHVPRAVHHRHRPPKPELAGRRLAALWREEPREPREPRGEHSQRNLRNLEGRGPDGRQHGKPAGGQRRPGRRSRQEQLEPVSSWGS